MIRATDIRLGHFCGVIYSLRNCIMDAVSCFQTRSARVYSTGAGHVWIAKEYNNVPATVGILVDDPVNPRLLVLVPRGCIKKELERSGRSISGTRLTQLIRTVTQIIGARVWLGESIVNCIKGTVKPAEKCEEILEVLPLSRGLLSHVAGNIRPTANYVLYEVPPSQAPQPAGVISRFLPSLWIEEFCASLSDSGGLTAENFEHLVRESELRLDDLVIFCNFIIKRSRGDRD